VTTFPRAQALGALPRDRVRAWAVSEPAALALLGGWFCLLAALTWGTWGDLAVDTGYDLVAAARVAGGEAPYRDFVYYYGPLSPYLLGGAFAVFGAGIGTAVAFGLALAAAIVGLSYALGRALAGRTGALLTGALATTALFSTGNMSSVLPYTASAPLAVALSLGLLLVLVRPAAGRGALLTAGALAGLICLTRPEFVAAAAVAIAIRQLARAADPATGPRGALGELGTIALPALAVPAVVYGAIATEVPPGALVTDNLLPLQQLSAAGEQIVRSAMPLTPSSFADLLVHAAVYAVGLAGLLALAAAIRRGGTAGRLAIAAAALGALGFLAVLAINPEALRTRLEWAYAWIPAGAAAATALLGWAALRRRRPASPALPLVVFLSVLAATTYAQFLPFATHFPNKAAYAMPFAAAFLAWLHLRVPAERGIGAAAALGAGWLALLAIAGGALAAYDARDEAGVVRGPGGSLADAPARTANYQQAVDWLVAETRPGEPVLIAPQVSWMHVVADRPNVLDHLQLLPGAAAAADERAAIAALTAADVDVAVIDTHRFTEYGHGAFGETFDRRVAAWLRGDFERVRVIGSPGDPEAHPLELWRRRSDAR
jgi:hypothetical protein